MDRTQFFLIVTDKVSKKKFYINHTSIEAVVPLFEKADERLPDGLKLYTKGGEFEVMETWDQIKKQGATFGLIKEAT